MTNEEKIVKGRHHLMMKVRQKYGDDTTNDDLMKIPLVGLHSIALQQIGEQEAYIEELEEKIDTLNADAQTEGSVESKINSALDWDNIPE